MTTVQKAWEEMRMNYQKRYSDMYRKVKKDERNTDNHGALIEMCYVLISVFGLTVKQVEEIEKNGGFTNADFDKL